MGEFQGVGPRTKARATSSYPANSSDRDLSAMEGNNNQTSPRSDQTSGYPVATDVSSSLVDSLRIQSQPRISEKHQRDELDTAINANSTKTTDTEQEEVERGDPDEGQSPVSDVTCDCGDPSLFKTAFDCNYHLPDEYRPVPHLVQCNYLFLKGDTMYRCLTCELAPATSDSTSSELIGERSLSEALWTCERCFDMDAHRDHKFEEFTNKRNEGLYCHCGSPDNCRSACSKSDTPKITPSPPVTQGEDKEEDEDESEDSDAIETECCDDHNRQTILCSKEIKEGTYYYKCESCQTDPTRVFCDPCFVKEAHVGHLYQRLCAPPVAFPVLGPGFDHNQQSNHSLPPTLQCACGENSAFRFATHCKQHERTGGTNVVLRCRYRARAGEWIAHCRTCFPDMSLGGHDPYLCMRCRQASDHQDHDITWAKTELDCIDHCSCGASQATGTTYDSEETDSIAAKGEDGEDEEEEDDDDDEHDPEFAPFSPSSSSATSSNHCGPILELRPLCSYHTMIYKTTPSTTLYLHSHQHRSINHQDHNEVSGYRYHNRDNDWIVSRPDKIANKPCSAASPSSSSSSSPSPSSSSSSSTSTQQEKGQQKQNDEESSKSLSPSLPLTNPLSPPPSPYLKWKDVFWLQHGQTGQFLNSMASLRINQGFQEISTLDGPHSNNDWIVEETTWLRQQILSDE
ncbi:hypothetical protein BGZ83_008774 [Gryganskiella cystojenkinii]|nr:hypothetical protein BGZ83_008774 [Gryganskiella cystojenkinii]